MSVHSKINFGEWRRTDLDDIAFHFQRSSDIETITALLGVVVDEDLR